MGVDSREMAEIGMHLSVIEFVGWCVGVVWDIDVDCHLIYSFILLNFKGLVSWLVALEIGSLVHIKP
jgi:hypothetical protein